MPLEPEETAADDDRTALDGSGSEAPDSSGGVSTHSPGDAKPGTGESERDLSTDPSSDASAGGQVQGGTNTSAGGQAEVDPPARTNGDAPNITVSGADVRAVQATSGDGNILATIFVGTDKGGEKSITPLLELTSRLPSYRVPTGHFADADIECHCRKLLDERLLLVSCADPRIARAAAHDVTAVVGLPPEQARLLNFDRLAGDDGQLTIHTLVKAPTETKVDILVVVDAVSHGATSFLDSLLGARGVCSSDDLKASLAERRLLVLCLAEPQRCAVPGDDDDERPFAHWSVQFLEHLLRPAFPDEHRDLARTIVQQRERGRWSREDQEFVSQVRSALRKSTLRGLVESGGMPVGARREFPLGSERPVHSTALFTAVYLPGLRHREFRRVVAASLADETARPALAAPSGAEAGEPRTERRLVDIWNDQADQIVRECFLSLSSDPDVGSVVGFTEAGERDLAKAASEEAHQFYVDRWFDSLHRAELLFDPVDAVAAAVAAMTVDFIASFPVSYGTRWVIDRLANAEKSGVRPSQRMKRLSELLRGLGERVEARPVMDGVLEQLLADGSSDVVFNLMRRLRFAPSFDAFRWMRQLMDRGAEEVRWRTYWMLYYELMGMERQVYPVLRTVSSWLPPPERPVANYSPANRLALRLLLEYAVDRAGKVEKADYGAWPTRYPLLASATPDALAADMALVAGWLLHPGMKSTLDRQDDREHTMNIALATLIAEWTFILFGPKGVPAEPADSHGAGEASPAPINEVGPDAVLTALLNAVLAATGDARGRKVRRAILGIWDEMKTVAAGVNSVIGPTHREMRDELAWQRRLVRMLALRFRTLQAAAAPSVQSTPD